MVRQPDISLSIVAIPLSTITAEEVAKLRAAW
jgi:hypothetical protein